MKLAEYPVCPTRARASQRGFTVVELMITLAVVAVLSIIAVPAMRNMAVQQRIGTAAQELQLDLAYARSEAVTRADSVSVCTSSNNTSCTASAWTGGRVIFVDTNQNGAVDGADVVLRKGGTPPDGLSLNVTPAGTFFVSFNPRGQANVLITFSTCYAGLSGRDLTVRNTGNPSITTPTGLCP